MNARELEHMVVNHPVLYHMAERGSWPSIRKHGLLSTSALLDLYGYKGAKRHAVESARRAESIAIEHPELGVAVVRDQKPMTDAGLLRALGDGLSPQDWYQMLNAKVFFWLTKERLCRLLNAGPYADKSHDVLFVETRKLIVACRERITLSPMNSGCTRPFPHKRGRETFMSIDQCRYDDWRKKRRREPAVELAVEGGVMDISTYVIKVVEMRGERQLGTIWER